MSLKFVYTRVDGGVSVVHAAPKKDLERVLGTLTHDQYVAHVLKRSIPTGATNVRELLEEDLPVSRKYRNAWVDKSNTSKIDLDMVQVKNLLLVDLRRERDVKLKESDSLVARALESGADMTTLKEKRQALRDATNALKAVTVSEADLNSNEKLVELESAAVLQVSL